MSNQHTGNVQPVVSAEEHRSKNVQAKATIVHGYIAGSDSFFPITAVDNGDGTYSLKSSATLSVASSATATLSSVASSASSVSLLASNANRKQATFYNDSTQILYLKLGTTASTTSYTVKMVASSYYELPSPVYTGAIDGIWASANGNVRITELT